jgi:radical SAM superfamily enzyme YgiQ (UPF0313 family)
MSTSAQILLLQPWIEDFYFTDCRTQPIGLAFLAGALKREMPDCESVIIDFSAGGHKQTIPWPKEFAYLKPYYGKPPKGPFALFYQYYRFGWNDKSIAERLLKFNPFLIGISALFTPYYKESLKLAKICKRLFAGVPVVMGGNHASLHPQTLLDARESTLSSPLCDYVIAGEAEESFVDLVKAVKNGSNPADFNIPNLIYKQKNILFCNPRKSPDPSRLPLPSFSGLNPSDYIYNKKLLSFVVTSRSCPHRCSFCSIHAVFGFKYRHIPVEQVLNYIIREYKKGVRHFDFEDDNLTFNKTYAMALFKGIKQLNLPDVELSAMNGLSYLSLDWQLLEMMKEINFSSLNISLVSSDKTVLKFSDRPHTVKKFKEIVNMAARLDIKVTAYFILGMPGQSLEEMWNTLCELASVQCLAGASPFYFTPGSPVHKKMHDDPSIHLASRGKDPFFSARLTAMDLENSEFARDDIYTLFRMTRVINFLKAGVDLGKRNDSDYFEPFFMLRKKGQWENETAPFSYPVWQMLKKTKLIITGYKTGKTVCFEPAQN